jgi:S-sulfo-L-cysteine synthase (O-acetyl-L-serine-dependent)
MIDLIGNTPLLPLPDGLADLPAGVEVWLKHEGANPGGSVKDRAAREIVLEAERDGRLRPGGTLLDASSGNTGIAYAMIAAARGYRLVLCLPRNASVERRQLLAAYGAVVVETSPLEGTDGAQREAVRLAERNPDWVYLNQYDNDANWRAHQRTTGPELWSQTRGRISHLVATVGTSGTLTGTARFLRCVRPDVQIVEVQPEGPMHGLEGVKHMATARVPGIYDPGLADRRLGADTDEAWRLVRALARRGLLVGPSSGAATAAAIRVAQELRSRAVVVAILPDSGARYLSDERIWRAEPEEVPWQQLAS